MKLVKVQAKELKKRSHLNDRTKCIQNYNKAGHRVEQTIVTYSELACRQLCAAITNTFPREIRDMIYFQMLRDKTYPKVPLKQYDMSYEPLLISPTSYQEFPPQFIRKGFGFIGKYCFDSVYVGSCFATEFTQACYLASTFICSPNTILKLPLLLRADAITPSHAIRPLELISHLELCFYPKLSRADLEALASLSKLKRKVSVVFVLHSREYRTLNTMAEIREYLDAYEDLYPVVCQTREYGHKLRVEFCWIKSDVMSKAELRSSVQLGFYTVSGHLVGGFLAKLILWKALKDGSKNQHDEEG
jgi:hypothetical protein